jgi:SPX domain protein involved in polyphosphate accumulation
LTNAVDLINLKEPTLTTGHMKLGNVSNLTVHNEEVIAFKEKIQNHNPIKVLATAKKHKPDIDQKNFDNGTPGMFLDSAMKPVRFVTGDSEETVTPTH